MAQHNELGKVGEEMAVCYLKEKGYTILARNWRFRKEEIDIVAQKDDILIIVEVKTRSSAYLAEPGQTVGKAKQRYLIQATHTFIEERELDIETRFDIISIILNNQYKKIEHFEDAFYSSLK